MPKCPNCPYTLELGTSTKKRTGSQTFFLYCPHCGLRGPRGKTPSVAEENYKNMLRKILNLLPKRNKHREKARIISPSSLPSSNPYPGSSQH